VPLRAEEDGAAMVGASTGGGLWRPCFSSLELNLAVEAIVNPCVAAIPSSGRSETTTDVAWLEVASGTDNSASLVGNAARGALGADRIVAAGGAGLAVASEISSRPASLLHQSLAILCGL